MKSTVHPHSKKTESPALVTSHAAGALFAPKLSLSVQYAIAAKLLPRWRLRRWVECALAYGANASTQSVELTLRLVSSAESQRLNLGYRTKSKPTNVLTFTYNDSDTDAFVMADIVVCTPVLKAEAHAQGKAYLDHAAHLVIHGALHALGYDHEKPAQARVMEGLERKILASLSIADPYRAEMT